ALPRRLRPGRRRGEVELRPLGRRGQPVARGSRGGGRRL
ncbi:MAG: Dipeptide-binding ABC transporter, periplasmic substrate-binding component, partial [uncultured Chloroflexi bacterium]